jgi:hypothetical protein
MKALIADRRRLVLDPVLGRLGGRLVRIETRCFKQRDGDAARG